MQEFARGLQLDSNNVDLQEGLKSALQVLSLEDLEQAKTSDLSAVLPLPDNVSNSNSLKQVLAGAH